ncbi:hypothetical protein [Candidatus Magnetobacterium casense]|uniref:Uncharacterized protein n=1 Tax=Candidatus Magnetobacterium casense TaxID=1455061 RepID=A0ABS6RUM8_9BACT|nr:hypothetical protein [Candidatus Magnetobacterium casensis]MBV6340339.1 hypothetical protein [Candidatus Magnetobacterium casensis]
MKTDEFKLGSKPFARFNIAGNEVEVRLVENKFSTHFCAYTELIGSKALSDSFLGCTFRKDDWVGVDTGHSFNQEQNLAERLCSALNQIERVITSAKEVLR